MYANPIRSADMPWFIGSHNLSMSSVQNSRIGILAAVSLMNLIWDSHWMALCETERIGKRAREREEKRKHRCECKKAACLQITFRHIIYSNKQSVAHFSSNIRYADPLRLYGCENAWSQTTHILSPIVNWLNCAVTRPARETKFKRNRCRNNTVKYKNKAK